MLPFETDVREEVKETAKDELGRSYELLKLGLDILGCDGKGGLQIPGTLVPGVGERALAIALGLYTKACKQFRSIILLAEAGYGSEVTVLTRALSETMLAMEFIMRETVVLKQGGKIKDFDPSKPLTTDFRAELYVARVAMVKLKEYRAWKEILSIVVDEESVRRRPLA